MSKFSLIQKHLLIDKPVEDVTKALSNCISAFETYLSYNFTSSSSELFALKLTDQTIYKTLNSYVIIKTTGKNHTQTKIEFFLFYKNNEGLIKTWFQRRKIRWVSNNFIIDFKKKCEKWL